ncbi:MAG: 2-C-methyl-D-erythritol 2,4-cyclodiphosphate synthase [Candidatus Omnitrophica bacterium]|nr:2-C-methyl-D-erythritol 2,4-cyclodiphosphate synthase [Candidatus Omnitrophota bacterium]MDD5237098.1 2-C-methyl-D-erythritol 2,4-cyclodiphosphate synthase [Candidatus Omnitrophota bacterium]MDD5610126.1 2-C-methyl-D-erythritol 2,4-cyclodiphosphate synthase [Candidatus Omnitrophota bacterium]
MQRIGIGYDIHRLKKGRRLVLGGVAIPYSHGLLGHSDADALLHALGDAFLGAAAAGDIGKHFPDTDPKYKGISSSILLKKIYALVKKKGYRVNNIDAIIIAEAPRLEKFKEKMARKIADTLGVPVGKINIKAKTHEGLGPLGKKEAIAAYAVVSLNTEKRK